MNAILSKFRGNSFRTDLESRKQSNQSVDAIQEENVLADEQDSATENISGTLTISHEIMKSPTDPTKDLLSSYQVPCDGNYATSSSVTFEVISAEVVRDSRSGHVNYTVLINPHKEALKSAQSVIIRRYSDFEQLHHQLKKRFPAIISHISFPRKILTGNFTSETIAKRSTAFEQYLTHLFSVFEIRYSSEFMEFFIRDDFSIAISFFINKEFSNAALNFERTVPVLQKLYGNSHPLVFHCLCGLVVSYMSMEKYPVAHTCAEMALQYSETVDVETLTSLIVTNIRLCWTLGKDKQEWEKKLESMRSLGVAVNSVQDLHDVMRKIFQQKSRAVSSDHQM